MSFSGLDGISTSNDVDIDFSNSNDFGDGGFSTSGKVQPGSQTKGLGIFQIIIGFIHVVFGTVSAVTVKSVSFYPGIIFWGAVTYILTGIMTIMAGSKKPRLMKCSMGMNILTILTGGTIVILMALEIAQILPFNHCYGSWSHFYCDIKWDLKPFCVFVMPTSGFQVLISIVNVTYEYKASYYPEPADIMPPSMNLNDLPKDDPPPYSECVL